MEEVDALGHALVHHYGIEEGRPGRHRHAQLPRVGHLLRRHPLGRRDLGIAQRVVDRRRTGLRHQRLAASHSSSAIRERILRSTRCCQRAGRAAAGRATRRDDAVLARRVERWDDVVVRGVSDARGRRRRRHRRDHPLHLGHDRLSQGCRLHARRDQQAILAFSPRAAVRDGAPKR